MVGTTVFNKSSNAKALNAYMQTTDAYLKANQVFTLTVVRAVGLDIVEALDLSSPTEAGLRESDDTSEALVPRGNSSSLLS